MTGMTGIQITLITTYWLLCSLSMLRVYYFPRDFECSKIHKSLNHGTFFNRSMQQVIANKPYE